MTPRKFCRRCKELRSKYDEYCSDCGNPLDWVEEINGVNMR